MPTPSDTSNFICAAIVDSICSTFIIVGFTISLIAVIRLSEACLEETVAHLVAALLLNTRTVSDDAVARMDADAQEISRFFAKFQKPERARPSPPLTTLILPFSSPVLKLLISPGYCDSSKRYETFSCLSIIFHHSTRDSMRKHILGAALDSFHWPSLLTCEPCNCTLQNGGNVYGLKY